MWSPNGWAAAWEFCAIRVALQETTHSVGITGIMILPGWLLAVHKDAAYSHSSYSKTLEMTRDSEPAWSQIRR